MVIAGANVPDFKLLEATLEAIVVARPEPTEEAPQHLCVWMRATTNSPLGKWWSATTTRRISDALENRRRTCRARNVIRRGDGWWSARWAGCRSAAPSWYATRKKAANSGAGQGRLHPAVVSASASSILLR